MDSLFSCDPGEMAKAFYYDTILYDGAALDYLVTKVGKERLVVGSDYPFTIKQDRPAEFAEAALGMARETFADNARSLLGLETRPTARRAQLRGRLSWVLAIPIPNFVRLGRCHRARRPVLTRKCRATVRSAHVRMAR